MHLSLHVTVALAFTAPLRPRIGTNVARAGTAVLQFDAALLFDCDGVIVETEELHRLAYNKAFDLFGLTVGGSPVVWDEAYYDVLVNTVGGGKPKMRHHFKNTCAEWPQVTAAAHARPTPSTDTEGDALIDDLQDAKTEFYKALVDESAEARPGALALMDAALAAEGLAVGICSASTRAGFDRVVDSIVGKKRLAKLDLVVAGDDVKAKKPDPMIYNLAAKRLGLAPERCLVIEDSMVGLRAANGARMPCLVTYTRASSEEDFYGEGAAATVADLVTNGGVSLSDLFDFSAGTPAVRADIASAMRDPKP